MLKRPQNILFKDIIKIKSFVFFNLDFKKRFLIALPCIQALNLISNNIPI